MVRGSLDIKTKQEKDIVAVILQGPINAATSPALRSEITEAFQKPLKGMVIEISQVNYIDSSALATLVEGMQLAEQAGKTFCLAGMIDEKIFHLLEITRLEGLFPQFDTLEEAIESLSSP
ncbi:anti-sigma factor antagonist [bacterium]|nr:anti-sigma factor antagonist [bacterium]